MCGLGSGLKEVKGSGVEPQRRWHLWQGVAQKQSQITFNATAVSLNFLFRCFNADEGEERCTSNLYEVLWSGCQRASVWMKGFGEA